jgi:hypothetical protein
MTSNKISQHKTLISSNFILFHHLLLLILMILKVFQNLEIMDLAMANAKKAMLHLPIWLKF